MMLGTKAVTAARSASLPARRHEMLLKSMSAGSVRIDAKKPFSAGSCIVHSARSAPCQGSSRRAT